MIDFYYIKELAVKHFYAWHDGEDFDWLRKNWSKFELETLEEAKIFIYCMGYIYDIYVCEAIKGKYTDRIKTLEEYCEGHDHRTLEIQNLIKDNLLKTYQKLYDVFKYTEELYREFSSITISFEPPHIDGYKYLKGIADEYDLEKSKEIIFEDLFIHVDDNK